MRSRGEAIGVTVWRTMGANAGQENHVEDDQDVDDGVDRAGDERGLPPKNRSTSSLHAGLPRTAICAVGRALPSW
jgi:hypothetical protein